ncbi:MAG: quinolinate synthase NadA [Candidatus Hodarchaeales archaeon]|jgi:quinolinate synthase
MTSDIIGEIETLKKELNCTILVHNYQMPQIQEIADLIGDSLYLAQAAAQIKTECILFCGVTFMAETAAIINPEALVIVPTLAARCPMAAQLSAEELGKWQQKYPNTTTVVYVNTLAETKALSDICVTSANAAQIIAKLDSERILFGPDRNLAWYVSQETDKEIIPIPNQGYCYVHRMFSTTDILEQKKQFPEAEVLVHPECDPSVQQLADKVLSTGGMMRYPSSSEGEFFIIATEIGLVDRLRVNFPNKSFIPARKDAICFQQKRNNLYNVYESLRTLHPTIEVKEDIANRARLSIEAMLSLS